MKPKSGRKLLAKSGAPADPVSGPVVGTLPQPLQNLLPALQQLLQSTQPKVASSTPNLKYAFEFFKIGSELMDIFTNLTPEPFAKSSCRSAPPFGGVYFVFRNNGLIYAGRTDNLRRRLLEHLGGKSNFAKQLIRRFHPTVYKEFLEQHLTLVYREVEEESFQRAVEHVAIGVFQPIFNRE